MEKIAARKEPLFERTFLQPLYEGYVKENNHPSAEGFFEFLLKQTYDYIVDPKIEVAKKSNVK